MGFPCGAAELRQEVGAYPEPYRLLGFKDFGMGWSVQFELHDKNVITFNVRLQKLWINCERY